MSTELLVVTAASVESSLSLLALLGSLNCNWRRHPRVLVYDIGLDDETLALLEKHDVAVRKVPAFCAHWREHYTWRFWCLNDAPALDIIWIDPRAVVLQPLDEVAAAIRANGYFATADREMLDAEAPADTCRACSLPIAFGSGRPALASAIMGFRKTGATGDALARALEIASVKEHIAPALPFQRPDQAILSLLLYQRVSPLVLSDSGLYLCMQSPHQTPGQKLWVHRGKLLKVDAEYLRSQLFTTAGGSYTPSAPFTPAEIQAVESILRACRGFARSDRTAAAAHLRNAVGSTAFMTPQRLAPLLVAYGRQLNDFYKDATGDTFVAWALTVVSGARGRMFLRRVRSAVYGLEGIKRLQNGEPEDGCMLLARSALTHPSFVLANRKDIMRVVTRAASESRPGDVGVPQAAKST